MSSDILENDMSELTPELFHKYVAYKDAYVYSNYYLDESKFDPKGTPELLDAFFTGCNLPFANHSIYIYTPQIEKDIKEIVRLSPSTIHCNMGHMICRNLVTPLHAACMNVNIPIHMIEFLLQNGANQHLPIKLNGCDILILQDLREGVTKSLQDLREDQNYPNVERYQEIKELFEKYEGNDGRYIKG